MGGVEGTAVKSVDEMITFANDVCQSVAFTYPVTGVDLAAFLERFQYIRGGRATIDIKLVEKDRVIVELLDIDAPGGTEVLYRHTLFVEGVPEEE